MSSSACIMHALLRWAALFLWSIQPANSPCRETRQALRHIYEIDSDGDDKISCEDLQQALGISDAAQGPLQASFEADSDVLLQTTTAEEDMPDAMMRSVTFGEQNQAESDTRTMSGGMCCFLLNAWCD